MYTKSGAALIYPINST